MSSGDPVVQVLKELPPGTNFATQDVRVGGSSPAESVLVFDFDATDIEYMDYLCQLVGYDGGGLTFRFRWSATSATSGSVRLEAAIRRMAADDDDIDNSHSYDFNGVTASAPSTNGQLSYDDIPFTSGSDMDDLANGEMFILRVRRDPTNGGDDMTGDMELWGWCGIES